MTYDSATFLLEKLRKLDLRDKIILLPSRFALEKTKKFLSLHTHYPIELLDIDSMVSKYSAQCVADEIIRGLLWFFALDKTDLLTLFPNPFYFSKSFDTLYLYSVNIKDEPVFTGEKFYSLCESEEIFWNLLEQLSLSYPFSLLKHLKVERSILIVGFPFVPSLLAEFIDRSWNSESLDSLEGFDKYGAIDTTYWEHLDFEIPEKKIYRANSVLEEVQRAVVAANTLIDYSQRSKLIDVFAYDFSKSSLPNNRFKYLLRYLAAYAVGSNFNKEVFADLIISGKENTSVEILVSDKEFPIKYLVDTLVELIGQLYRKILKGENIFAKEIRYSLELLCGSISKIEDLEVKANQFTRFLPYFFGYVYPFVSLWFYPKESIEFVNSLWITEEPVAVVGISGSKVNFPKDISYLSLLNKDLFYKLRSIQEAWNNYFFYILASRDSVSFFYSRKNFRGETNFPPPVLLYAIDWRRRVNFLFEYTDNILGKREESRKETFVSRKCEVMGTDSYKKFIQVVEKGLEIIKKRGYIGVREFEDFSRNPVDFFISISKVKERSVKPYFSSLDMGTIFHRFAADIALQNKEWKDTEKQLFERFSANNNFYLSFQLLQLRDLLYRLFLWHLRRLDSGWNLKGVEVKCDGYIRGVRFIGRVDRIDFHPSFGSSIVDFKLLDSRDKLSNLGKSGIQLFLYSLISGLDSPRMLYVGLGGEYGLIEVELSVDRDKEEKIFSDIDRFNFLLEGKIDPTEIVTVEAWERWMEKSREKPKL